MKSWKRVDSPIIDDILSKNLGDYENTSKDMVIEIIKKFDKSLKDLTIIDVGVAGGYLGALIKETCKSEDLDTPNIIGVEISNYPLEVGNAKDYYDHIFVCDFFDNYSNIFNEIKTPYIITHLGEVLEHYHDLQKIEDALFYCIENSEYVSVGTPCVEHEFGEEFNDDNNPSNNHQLFIDPACLINQMNPLCCSMRTLGNVSALYDKSFKKCKLSLSKYKKRGLFTRGEVYSDLRDRGYSPTQYPSCTVYFQNRKSF